MRDEAAKQKAEDSSNITPANSVSSNPLNNFQAHYFLFAFFLITVLLGLVLWPFWQLLIMAFLLAGIFRPAYSYLLKAVPPWFSSLLTCALIVLIVFIPLMFCIGALSSEALNVYQLGKDSNVLLKVQHLLQNNTLAMEAQEVLARYNINFNPTDLTGMIAGMARTLGLFIYNQASTWAGNIMSFALQFCILILVTFFLFMELDRLIYFLKKLSPLPDKQTDLLMDKFMEISGAILVGNGISGVFQGVLGG
ncbi:MAG: AI-2E family transporter, partial [Desulfobulbaceae bacterium]|nr:AI-2E family transporter [Desulfobulbaceae bacterium]